MRITIFSLLFLCSFFKTTKSTACGNAYYFQDRPLPLIGGFLDYDQLFFSVKDSATTFHQHHLLEDKEVPYFFTYGNSLSKYPFELYRDKDYLRLRDTLLKLLGSPKNSYKLSNEDIGKKALLANIDFKILSDFAWKLAQRKEWKTAEKILSTLVKTHEDAYNVLANLGTVYELLDQPRLALLYLAKAVQLSPESHYGSEWLHINILKRKLGLLNNYDYTGFFELDPTNVIYSDYLYKKEFDPAKMGKFHRDTLMKHLAYQLHERMFFIPGNDPLMAEMMYMFTQCMIHRGDCTFTAESAKLFLLYDNRRERIFEALSYCLHKK